MELHAKTLPPSVLPLKVIATQALELLTSVVDTEFVVESVSTPQPQALNQNPSIV